MDMLARIPRTSFLMLLFPALIAAGCAGEAARPDEEAASSETPVLETRADSVAMRVYDAFGGPQAWAALPYLRFNFAVARGGGEPQVVARHLWNRRTGAYRVEWNAGPDSSYVALFNAAEAAPDSVPGRVYLNGSEVSARADSALLRRAYARFVNDTYWLLAPVKLFDPGVNRAYVPDSSTADTEVLKLTFGEVGLTPDDRYWLYVDKETGRLRQWAFVLQDNPEAPPRFYDWGGYETHPVPGTSDSVTIATRKDAAGAPVVLSTDAVEVPAAVPDSLFAAPEPLLR